MIYRLSPDLKEVVQQPILELWEMPSGESYHEYLHSLPRFPARGFTEKWLEVDLKEGENLKFVKDKYAAILHGLQLQVVAVPIVNQEIEEKTETNPVLKDFVRQACEAFKQNNLLKKSLEEMCLIVRRLDTNDELRLGFEKGEAFLMYENAVNLLKEIKNSKNGSTSHKGVQAGFKQGSNQPDATI